MPDHYGRGRRGFGLTPIMLFNQAMAGKRNRGQQAVELARQMNLPVTPDMLKQAYGRVGAQMDPSQAMIELDIAKQLIGERARQAGEYRAPTRTESLIDLFRKGGAEDLGQFLSAGQQPEFPSRTRAVAEKYGLDPLEAYQKEQELFPKATTEGKPKGKEKSKAFLDATRIAIALRGGGSLVGIQLTSEEEKKKFNKHRNQIMRLLMAKDERAIQRAVYEDGVIDEKTGALIIQQMMEDKK